MARRSRRAGFFFVGWTVLAVLAVCWLVRRADATKISPSWFIEGDAASNASLSERLGNWFKLADLNFHGIYPWILMAPYVAWLGARFQLERGRWRVSLPAHLAGCALFVAASHALALSTGWGRQFVVTFSTETNASLIGNQTLAGKTIRTNEFTISTNAYWPRFRAPWGGGGPANLAPPPDVADMQAGGAAGWTMPGKPGVGHSLYWRQRASQSLSALFYVFAYAAIVGVAHTVHFYRRSREREGRASALEVQLTKARLNALQAQLHPHFLFNALNAISTLLRREDTRAAQDALASFSELLRLALCHSTQPEVALREDLEFLRRYVEIQQTRLGARLRFEEVIDPEALDALVPALLLQPLVENAIRHGIEPSANPGLVRVIVEIQGGRLAVTVEDNGAGLSNKENARGGAGIGLQNLRSRLESLYGAQQSVQFGPRKEDGVAVRVEFPLRTAPPARTTLLTP